MTDTVRPTKKQRELLNFIEQFIGQHGYSPSYREIMTGLHYTSVATVALHINNLIKRGHLRKRDHSARSLEVVTSVSGGKDAVDSVQAHAAHTAQWLLDKIEALFAEAEQADELTNEHVNRLETLLRAMDILGLTEAVPAYAERMQNLHDQRS